MRKLRGIFVFLIVFLAVFLASQMDILAQEGSEYSLPYPAGLRIFLTQGPFSTGEGANHTCYFAVDMKAELSDGKWGAAFVVAARSGYVVYVNDKNGNEATNDNDINLVVLGHGRRDAYGQFQEYSWYLHLAKNSVPDYVIPGMYIRRGVVIGKEGFNGNPQNVHLHFGVTNWFNPSRMYCVGNEVARVKAYVKVDNSLVYAYMPFSFVEWEDIGAWPEGNWVGSQNVITEVTTDPNEPQP